MLTQKDIKELQNNVKKEKVSFSRMRGCYVDFEKNKVCEINKRFLTLPESEFNRYLEIAQQIFKAKVEEKIISLDFHPEVERTDKLLDSLIESNLEDDAAVEEFYDKIIKTYSITGNYLILLYKDSYDVVEKGTDGAYLYDSEITYSYIICAICPVTLTKAGIKCDKGGIEPRVREWLVQKPDIGFVYPSFEQRVPEKRIMYYASKSKEPHHELMLALETIENMFAEEHLLAFDYGVKAAVQDEEEADRILKEINFYLKLYLEERNVIEAEEVRFTPDLFVEICDKYSIPRDIVERMLKDFTARYQYIDFPKIKWIYSESRAKEYILDKNRNKINELIIKCSDALTEAGKIGLASKLPEVLKNIE